MHGSCETSVSSVMRVEHALMNTMEETKLLSDEERHFRELPREVSHMFQSIQKRIEEDTVQAFYELQGVEPNLDLLEVCAPWDSPLVEAVQKAGGHAMAIGLHNDYDLATRRGFVRAAALIRQRKPKYLHVSPPCFPWTPLQNCNQKTDKQKHSLQEKRRYSHRIMLNIKRLCQLQHDEMNGHVGTTEDPREQRHFGGEHPLRASSWKQTVMGKLARHSQTVWGSVCGSWMSTWFEGSQKW